MEFMGLYVKENTQKEIENILHNQRLKRDENTIAQ